MISGDIFCVSNVYCMCSFACALYMFCIKLLQIHVLKNAVLCDVMQFSLIEIYSY